MTDKALIEFAKWAIEASRDGYNLDGSDIQDKALRLGLIVETKYDPEKHGESDCAEPGDSWYVFADVLKEDQGRLVPHHGSGP